MTHQRIAVEVPGPISIDRLDAVSSAAWGAYVADHPAASFYHRHAWFDLIRDVFGHHACPLLARHGSEIVGVLPLVRLKSRLFGDYLVSMPYFNYGGVLADSAEIAQQLMVAAGRMASGWGCSHVEFRDVQALGGWPVRADKVCMELRLPASVDDLWKSWGSKLRAQVRRPRKEGVVAVFGGIELLDDFYAVFARNMRDLGTPVYPRRFFAAILRTFPGHASIVAVRHRGRPVAAGFLHGFRDRLEIPWASSLREYNPIGVNMHLYAEVLQRAVVQGYRFFDFGRSSVGGGTHRFKQQWGAQERPLYWHYWLADGKGLPQLNPSNPKYRLAIAAWQRLPVCVANRLGPAIVGNLP